MTNKEMCIANEMEAMPHVVEMVEKFGAQNNIPNLIVNEINLVLDELLNNIISYGYGNAEKGRGRILIRLSYAPGEVSAEIHDDGVPFDPLQTGPPDLSGTVQTRKIGGLGIHFVRELMDDVVYTRIGGENRLLLRKKVTT